MKYEKNQIPVLVLPGGRLPVQGRPGEDVGYDLFVNSVVTDQIDPETGRREVLWDFRGKPHESITDLVCPGDNGYGYTLNPGASVKLGFGIILGMPNHIFACTCPRSSTANMHLCIRGNHHDFFWGVPIDPGFRGEICGEIQSSHDSPPFHIRLHWRPSQLVFGVEAGNGLHPNFARPKLLEVSSIEDLGRTVRGISWNGSSDTPKVRSGPCQLDLKFG